MRSLQIISSVLAISACLAGCGSDSDGDSFGSATSNRVIEVDVFEPRIPVGGSTDVALRFSYSANDVFEDDEIVVLLIRLPKGVEFVNDSAELDTIRDEESVSAENNTCGSGESVVIIELDDDDLDQAANIEGDADAEVTIKVRGTNTTDGSVPIEARADASRIFFDCNEELEVEASGSLQVG